MDFLEKCVWKVGKSYRCMKILDEECKCNGVDNGFCILEFESMILKSLNDIEVSFIYCLIKQISFFNF